MSIILHIDMNSYFASVEQQANPHLQGKPVGVCEHLGGIIIAPSVEAKRLGIKLGTTVWDALKICPQMVLLPTDPEKYRSVTARFLKILFDYSDEVERYGIDEAFLDLTTACRGSYDDALLLALEIKQRLKLEVGEWVSASIGIGPNKLVAKIAADLDGGVINFGCHSEAYSPKNLVILRGYPQDDKSFLDRICVVRPEQVGSLYEKLNLTDVPGIAKNLERALNKLGIFSLLELARYPLSNLLNQFGINGWVLHSLANFNFPVVASAARQSHWDRHGLWPRDDEVMSEDPPKSFGHAYTVAKPLNDQSRIKKLMFKLAEKVGRRMRKHGAAGNIVHYFHSDKQHDGFSKQRKIREFINDGKDIFQAAWKIFKTAENSSIKIMGVSVSGLAFNEPSEPLFDEFKKPAWLIKALDQINDKYGEYTITRGRFLGAAGEWVKDTVGFGRTRS